MKLTVIRVEHRDFVGQLIGAALRLQTDRQLWIIVPLGRPDDRQLCVELEDGEIEAPDVAAVLGVSTEPDHFYYPSVRVNLGAGVWPL